MIVCVCHRVSDRDIERHVHQGCASFDQLQHDLKVATNCGRCLDCALDTFDHAVLQQQRAAAPATAAPGRVFPIGLVPAA